MKHKRYSKNLRLALVIVIIIGTVVEVTLLQIVRHFLCGEISESAIQPVNTGFIVVSIAVGIINAIYLFHTILLSDEMTNRDPLTQVANSDRTMSFAWKKYYRHTLHHYTAMFLNVKDFRYVNNQVGSRVGHDVMHLYATALKNKLGRKNYIGRLGGDNFMIYVHNEELEDFLKFLQPVVVHVETENGPRTLKIYARAGIFHPTEKDDVSHVMASTSVALAYAKYPTEGDLVWFREEMLSTVLKEKDVLNSFDAALASGEFCANYQPKVDLKTQKICGCEALTTWHRNGTVIPPDDFVPYLEKSGKVVELDMFIFRRVCEYIKELQSQGIEPPLISSNFSKMHLLNPTLAEDIIAIVEEYNVDPKYIELEITESSGYVDMQALDRLVKRVREYGFRVSLDDFGTGYSSLSLLKDMDSDEVKLDKSFLKNMETEDGKQFVRNIIHMIQDMGREVICEGIEEKEQLDFLIDANCDKGQGYLFGRAVMKDEFTKILLDEK